MNEEKGRVDFLVLAPRKADLWRLPERAAIPSELVGVTAWKHD